MMKHSKTISAYLLPVFYRISFRITMWGYVWGWLQWVLFEEIETVTFITSKSLHHRGHYSAGVTGGMMLGHLAATAKTMQLHLTKLGVSILLLLHKSYCEPPDFDRLPIVETCNSALSVHRSNVCNTSIHVQCLFLWSTVMADFVGRWVCDV